MISKLSTEEWMTAIAVTREPYLPTVDVSCVQHVDEMLLTILPKYLQDVVCATLNRNDVQFCVRREAI